VLFILQQTMNNAVGLFVQRDAIWAVRLRVAVKMFIGSSVSISVFVVVFGKLVKRGMDLLGFGECLSTKFFWLAIQATRYKKTRCSLGPIQSWVLNVPTGSNFRTPNLAFLRY
jgi:hypothetical protein